MAWAQPGAVLPGGFEIGARKTYGRMSEGMLCAADELGIGTDHSGILVLPEDAPLGADFVAYAGLRDEVLDIAVTPDRGYCVSVRGVARELAIAFGVTFTDPADAGLPAHAGLGADLGWVSGDIRPASIADPSACDRFVLREVRSFRPGAPTPLWMRVRLARSGDADHLAGRGRDQLPDAGARPAAARVRQHQAERADRGAPGPAGGAAGDPRPCGPRRWNRTTS